MSQSSPTIYDVAKTAGVSAMTVSRCLRNHGNVKPETRARVEAAVAQLGYRSHPYVQALMSTIRRNSGAATLANLAYVIPGNDEHWSAQHSPTRESLAAARATAESQGFTLTQIPLADKRLSGARLAKILRARNCQGFIVGPPEASEPLPIWADFPWEDFSAIGIGLSPALPPVLRVATNHYHLMQQILRNLRKTGIQRIGLALSSAADSRVDGLWTAAYLRHQKRNYAGDPIPILELNEHAPSETACNEWLTTHRIEAAIANFIPKSTALEKQALAWIQLYSASIALPNGSRIERDFAELGASAARLLIANLITNERGLPRHSATYLIDAQFRNQSVLS